MSINFAYNAYTMEVLKLWVVTNPDVIRDLNFMAF